MLILVFLELEFGRVFSSMQHKMVIGWHGHKTG
jgi:hypothetical protein